MHTDRFELQQHTLYYTVFKMQERRITPGLGVSCMCDTFLQGSRYLPLVFRTRCCLDSLLQLSHICEARSPGVASPLIIPQHNLGVSHSLSLRTTALVAIPKHHISLELPWTHKQFMTMYTSSEINVALRGNQTVSIYDIYCGGTTPGNLGKRSIF